MTEVVRTPVTIPQELMLARLAQSEQMREFFIQMWLQNPSLAQQAGPRVGELLAALPEPARSVPPETIDGQ
ncbi:MAG: hypothetical protein K9J74_12145 [Sulfuritalea sp.]|nr:hypothetical protein [Sulfuritalea sp.]